ncbi:uncharacterized protein A4U43_C08F13610 [Asparagus officinalis]|nr:uncharacterized protein A4U43_C08F13610 [Asparagus officinalis]
MMVGGLTDGVAGGGDDGFSWQVAWSTDGSDNERAGCGPRPTGAAAAGGWRVAGGYVLGDGGRRVASTPTGDARKRRAAAWPVVPADGQTRRAGRRTGGGGGWRVAGRPPTDDGWPEGVRSGGAAVTAAGGADRRAVGPTRRTVRLMSPLGRRSNGQRRPDGGG